MSGISKTIERVKEFHEKWENEHDPKAEKVLNDLNKIYFANAIMPIITAYEESQKELKKAKLLLTEEETISRSLRLAYDVELDGSRKRKAELGTANKRIAELRALLKRVEPSMATTRELYRDITKALYVPKEQADDEHKGE